MPQHSLPMSKADKYENQYRETRNCCGGPFHEIVAVFDTYHKDHARVLDLGCGQGRNALMAARLGHFVLGVDASRTGVQQMLGNAEEEGVDVQGVVADLNDYEIDRDFGIIIPDRILHMLEQQDRTCVLRQYSMFRQKALS